MSRGLISLDPNGEPQSQFVLHSAGRRLNLGQSGEPHVIQRVFSGWTTVSSALHDLSSELLIVEGAKGTPDGEMVAKHFRKFIYDATELFDVYAQMLPSRLNASSRISKDAINDYKKIAKNHRDFSASLCNRCKHFGTEIKFLWCRSKDSGLGSSRFIACAYTDGDSLLRDEQIHHGNSSGIGITRTAYEIIHGLFRIDIAAASLLKKLPDQNTAPLKEVAPSLRIRKSLDILTKLTPTHLDFETSMYDSVALELVGLTLPRSQSKLLSGDLRFSIKHKIQPGTSNYAIE